jgi:hypothetical protein
MASRVTLTLIVESRNMMKILGPLFYASILVSSASIRG